MPHNLTNLHRPFIVLAALIVFFNIAQAQKKKAAPSAVTQIQSTNGEERMRSLQLKKELLKDTTFAKVNFRNIGPSIMSGRVVDLEVNPADPTEFYVAYATGGLWHTVNNGQSFTPIFDSEEVIGIGDIAVNWKNAIIWVGTGEANSSRSSYAGSGIFKSTNNGKSWEYMGLPESHHIGKVMLHPTDANTAWVAVLGHLYSPNKERGVYKTTDGGKTWKQTLYVDDNTGVVEMDLNPKNPSELYAAAWYKTRKAWNFEEGGKNSGIYKSNDGGETWKLVTQAGSGFPTGDSVGRIGIAVHANNPKIVYAVVDNQRIRPDTSKPDTTRYILKDFKNISKEQFLSLDENKLNRFLRRSGVPAKYNAKSLKDMVRSGELSSTALHSYLYDANEALTNGNVIGCEVYRSDDGGMSWRKTHEKPGTAFSTYGYYFAKIAVSEKNPDKIVVLGFDATYSADGGKTFTRMDKGNTHADWHAVWINPSKDSHFIAGNDGGCNITYDNGKTWFKANTPPVGQFYAIAVDNDLTSAEDTVYNVYGGLQDNGTWYGPSNYKEDIGWIDNGEYGYKSVGGGDGMQVQVDNRDNSTFYAGYQFGNYFRGNRIKRGENKFIKPMPDIHENPLRYNWQSPILLSTHNQDILYFGTNKVYRSMNKGDDFSAISGDLTKGAKSGDVPFATITTLSESPLKFSVLYAGTDDGNVHASQDGGNNWKLVSGSFPQGLYVSRILASRHKASRVYVTLNGYREDHFNPYLYVSDDYGTTWKSLGNGLPMEPLNVVREDHKYDSILYVGSDGGVYVSLDAGSTFQSLNKGLPVSIPVHDIAIQEKVNELVLGTHGRSIYIAPLGPVHEKFRPGSTVKKEKPATTKN